MKSNAFRKIICLALLVCLCTWTWAQNSNMLDVKELSLSNGMSVWLNEDHSQPKVFGAVVVQAGAKDCPNTGIAHYFEHIMFKGTDEIGTVDYAHEKPWLDSIASAYDRLARTTDAAQRSVIQRDINRLSQKAGEYAIPNEFNSLIARCGGSELNAGTSFDFTFYHNKFTAQYMEQWCWLNSDRLINPVFRMFQGELETVYEEKNMGTDNMETVLRESVMAELFGTQPYAYPIIGSTENLKNPKLSEMKKFYEQYYVGSNMGLVLSGDFDADSIMPLLERTFGRIPRGTQPVHPKSPLPDILQERTVELKVPIPILSMEMLVYKSPTEYEKDANALSIATSILSNSKAGLLDSLSNEGHLLVSVMMPMSLNDAGVTILAVVPNLLSKTEKAETACLQQVKRIMDGDFSDEAFEIQKQEARRNALRQMETIDDRGLQMVMVMSSGHRWQDYLNKVNDIEKVTKADVMAVTKKYFNAPFIRFKKKYGNNEKDKISQPDYTPVKPKNRNAESAYAKRLAQMPVDEKELRLIDFDHDAITTPLGGQATLYTAQNPVNDLFTLNIRYNRGERADSKLSVAAQLLNLIGTDSLSRQQFGTALQTYGADLSFKTDRNYFLISVTGVDKHFQSTMHLLNHFLNHVQSNEKSLKQMKSILKTEEKGLTEENSNVMQGLLMKMMYGEQSDLLHRPTYKEIKKMTGDEILKAFQSVFGSHCTITYSGTLDASEVAKIMRTTLPLQRCQAPYIDYTKTYMAYAEPIVYVYNMPKSRQTLLVTYEQMKPQPTLQGNMVAELFNQYFGGGSMSSLLFQEVREFRSMAYSTQSIRASRSLKRYPNSPSGFITYTGTQADKTMKAIALVDSLLGNMPLVEKNFQTCRQGMINDLSNDFPSFRSMGYAIASQRLDGYTCDKNTGLPPIIMGISMEDMKTYYETNIKNNARHRAIGIVGNKKKLNLKELEKYGKVVFVKDRDLFRK